MKYIALFLAAVIFLPVAQAHYVSTDDDNKIYYTVFSFYPEEPPAAGEETRVQIGIFNYTTGEPFKELDVVHERKVHVFVVGQDFGKLVHTHPDDYENGTVGEEFGTYEILNTFEKAGRYSIVADYTVEGTSVIKRYDLSVEGKEKMGAPFSTKFESGNPGGYETRIRILGDEKPRSGREVEMEFRLERDGRPLRDIQMLLGAELHMFVIKDDLTRPDHTHAYRPGHSLHLGKMSQVYYGPDVPVRYTFKESGRYAVFAQWMHDGNMITERFEVDVEDDPYSLAVMYGLFIAVGIFAFFVFRTDVVKILGRGKST